MVFDLITGDCLHVMATMEDGSIDTIITDPPYGLKFMSKDWDHGVPGIPFWKQALRVAKPGAMLLAFGGTRTYHRLTCAIEDAGWEIRDCIMWVYGSGFPKSHNISKAIDKAAGAEREVVGAKRAGIGRHGRSDFDVFHGSAQEQEKQTPVTVPATPDAQLWDGYGTGLKPAWEPIIVAMKPIDGTYSNNALTHGVAGLNIEDCRVPISDGATMARNNQPGVNGWKNSSGGPNSAAVNGEPSGRWPANVVHDGSDEVVGLFPQTKSGMTNSGSAARFFYCAKASVGERNAGLEHMPVIQKYSKNGQGSSHEIFTSESAKDDEWKKKNPNIPRPNHHPTVKPLALMRYLVKLTRTPVGGTVFDPFMGSGTTGVAALLEDRDFIGIEQDPDYCEIARQRLSHEASKQKNRQLELCQLS